MSLREIEERFEKKHASLFKILYHSKCNSQSWKQNMLKQVHVYDATREENEGVMKNVLMNVNTKRSRSFFTLRCLFINVRPPIEEKWEEMLNTTEQIDWKVIWSFNLQAMKENKISESILSYYTTYYQ